MIWLVGNKGMLGQEVEKLLEASNLKVTGTDREIDITDISALRSFAAGKKIEWIINCSAYTAVDKAEDEPDIAFKINADGVKNIGIVAKELGCRVIHVSTDYVYDGVKEGIYFESDNPLPASVYGKTKLAGEEALAAATQNFFTLRTSWLYGPRGNNFVFTMLRLFRERDAVSVVGDQHGSPTYAPDLAAAMVHIITSNSNAFGTYHFSNEGVTTWHGFAEKILSLATERGLLTTSPVLKSIRTEEYPTKAVRPKNSKMSKEKIKKNLGIAIRNWDDALMEFMNYIKENNL